MTNAASRGTAVVIGAGIAGLATGALLAREGYRVSIVEARDQIGGRAGTWAQDGFRFDTGPSWYLMPEVFDHFFRLLGTSSSEQLQLQTLDPGYRVFFEGHESCIDIASDVAANESVFESIETGGAVALRKYLGSADDTYRMALQHFLYSTFESVRSLLVPALLRRAGRLVQLLLQPLDRFIRGYVRDPRLRQILGYPAVFLGSSPARTPSLYHLMSALDLGGGIQYPAGGLIRVIEAISACAQREGADLVMSTEVERIVTRPADGGPGRRGGFVATGVQVRDEEGRTRQLAADVVVSTADLHHTETELLLPGEQSYPERWWRTRVAGPSAVLVLLGIRGPLDRLTHHNLFFTADWKANFSRIFDEPTSVPDPASMYVCRPSASDRSTAPEGFENLFVLIPVPPDPTIGEGTHDGSGAVESAAVERAADQAIARIAEWARVPDLADRVVLRRTIGPRDFEKDFHSWKGSALGPAHTLRQSAFLRGRNVSSKVRGLYYAGATTVPGIGLPMCLISAEAVIKRLRGDTTSAPLPEPL
jgi:phytoene desaturase